MHAFDKEYEDSQQGRRAAMNEVCSCLLSFVRWSDFVLLDARVLRFRITGQCMPFFVA